MVSLYVRGNDNQLSALSSRLSAISSQLSAFSPTDEFLGKILRASPETAEW
jgi:hypothetical protein